MQKTIIVTRTKNSAIYVDGILMRTRHPYGTISNKDAVISILRDVIVRTHSNATGTDVIKLAGEFSASILISNSEFMGGTRLNLNIWRFGSNYHQFSVYYDQNGERVYLPCGYWFKRITGIKLPKKVWIKSVFTFTAA